MELLSLFRRKKTTKGKYRMILGNIEFLGVKLFEGLLVESAVCLETGKRYNKEQAQKFYHLYKIYA